VRTPRKFHSISKSNVTFQRTVLPMSALVGVHVAAGFSAADLLLALLLLLLT
jgi:hypothetical protein